MLASRPLVAFVTVADRDQAREFYEHTLGLPLVEDSPFALVFDALGTTLRVAISPDASPAPYPVLGWMVPDIATAVVDLRSRGAAMSRFPGMAQDDDGIWTAPGGARVAWFTDPHGNVLSLTELPTDQTRRP